MRVGPFVEAFLFLIVIPLLLAVVTQVLSRGKASGERIMNATAWLPVPMMAFALIVVVASQIGKVYNDMAIIVNVIPIYVAFLIIMPWISRFIATGFGLNPGAGRALIFSSATRNSLVVLPLALALPGMGNHGCCCYCYTDDGGACRGVNLHSSCPRGDFAGSVSRKSETVVMK